MKRRMYHRCRLLSVSADAKTVKGQTRGYLTGILYLSPHTLAGHATLCPYSTPGCRDACLYTAGNGGRFASVNRARLAKTRVYWERRDAFLEALSADLSTLVTDSDRVGLSPAVRLNGTTDIPWEIKHPEILRKALDLGIRCYDYTKIPPQYRKPPEGYHIVYSVSEELASTRIAIDYLDQGGTAAVVFSGTMPDTWYGFPVVDGTKDDLRFLDPPGSVIGLKPLGKARKDTTGFVQQGRE